MTEHNRFIFMLFLSITVMVTGIIGWILPLSKLTTYFFIHIGALGLISMLSCFSAGIAGRKGYGFWKPYWSGLLIPIFLGVISALLWPVVVRGNLVPCGGSVALLGSLGVFLYYNVFLHKRHGVFLH